MKDGTALEFLLVLLSTLKSEKGGAAVTNVIKKSGAENRLMDFFPSVNQQQTEENFQRVFTTRDLPEVVAFRKQVAAANMRSEFINTLKESIEEERPTKDIIVEMKDLAGRTGINEQDGVALVWQCVMAANEWNKKEDLLQEQAVRHVKRYIPLFTAFTNQFKSELVLLNKIQEYCYDNMTFIKSFNKIVLLLYKSEFLHPPDTNSSPCLKG